LSQVQARAKRYCDAKRRQIEFDVGNYVWKKAYPTTDGTKHFSAKLAKRFSGPYKISRRIRKNVYELVDDKDLFKGRWHVKDLKPDCAADASDDDSTPDRDRDTNDDTDRDEETPGI
jgi:hypothetical protein